MNPWISSSSLVRSPEQSKLFGDAHVGNTGVAFDHSLSRLGHGKGYYDRFITTYLSMHNTKPMLGWFEYHKIYKLVLTKLDSRSSVA